MVIRPAISPINLFWDKYLAKIPQPKAENKKGKIKVKKDKSKKDKFGKILWEKTKRLGTTGPIRYLIGVDPRYQYGYSPKKP